MFFIRLVNPFNVGDLFQHIFHALECKRHVPCGAGDGDNSELPGEAGQCLGH